MKFKRLYGAHMSVAGGLATALFRGKKLGCTAIQIFTKNNNQWGAKPISDEERSAFLNAVEETGIEVSLAHSAYLINLASPVESVRERSLRAMEEEMRRACRLEIPYLVLHPGSHTGTGLEAGMDRIADAINEIHEKEKSEKPMILLECMAGQGSSIGSKFEELAAIIELIEEKTRIGVCLDTCHLFAAGYDIRTNRGFADVLQKFADVVGIERVKAFHLNDSKKEFACHVDRHDHIGKGFIGLEAFRYLLNESRFASVPMILETPKSDDDAFDEMNLSALRSFMA